MTCSVSVRNAAVRKDLLAGDRITIHLHSKQVDFSNRWKFSKVILVKNAYFNWKVESGIVFHQELLIHTPRYLIKSDL